MVFGNHEETRQTAKLKSLSILLPIQYNNDCFNRVVTAVFEVLAGIYVSLFLSQNPTTLGVYWTQILTSEDKLEYPSSRNIAQYA